MTTQTTETIDQIDNETTGSCPDQSGEAHDNDMPWRLVVNGVESGEISNQRMILAHSLALFDKYNHMAQARTVIGAIYRLFSISLGSIPIMAIMVALLAAVAAPHTLTAIASVLSDASPDEISGYAMLTLRVGASFALVYAAVVFVLDYDYAIGSAMDRVAEDHFLIIRSIIGETATGHMYLRRGNEVYPPRHNLLGDIVKADWVNFFELAAFALILAFALYSLFQFLGIYEFAAVVSSLLFSLQTSIMVARWYQRHWSFFRHGETMLNALLEDKQEDQEANPDNGN